MRSNIGMLGLPGPGFFQGPALLPTAVDAQQPMPAVDTYVPPQAAMAELEDMPVVNVGGADTEVTKPADAVATPTGSITPNEFRNILDAMPRSWGTSQYFDRLYVEQPANLQPYSRFRGLEDQPRLTLGEMPNVSGFSGAPLGRSFHSEMLTPARMIDIPELTTVGDTGAGDAIASELYLQVLALLAAVRSSMAQPEASYESGVLKSELLHPASLSLVGQYTNPERALFGAALSSDDLPRPLTLSDLRDRQSSIDANPANSLLVEAFIQWRNFLGNINSPDFNTTRQITQASLDEASKAIEALTKALSESSDKPTKNEIDVILNRWQNILEVATDNFYGSIGSAPYLSIAIRGYELGLYHFAHMASHRADNIEINPQTTDQDRMVRLRAAALHLLLHAVEGGDDLLNSSTGGRDPFSSRYFNEGLLAMLSVQDQFGPIIDFNLQVALGALNLVQPQGRGFYDASRESAYFPALVDVLGVSPSDSFFTDLDEILNTNTLATAQRIKMLSLKAYQQWRRAIDSIRNSQRDHLAIGIRAWKIARNALDEIESLSPSVEGLDAPIDVLLNHWNSVIKSLTEVFQGLQKARNEVVQAETLDAVRNLLPGLQISFALGAKTMGNLGFSAYAERIIREYKRYEGIVAGRSPD